jgi:uncharacterized protein (DUF885 family)
MRLSLTPLLLPTVLVACHPATSPQASGPLVAAPPGEATRVTRLADEYVAAYIAHFPEQAEAAGIEITHHDGLTDNSLQALAEWRALEDDWATSIATIDSRSLWGRPEWITLGFMREAVEASRQARVCHRELWPVHQISGWLDMASEVAATQPVGTSVARSEALARFDRLPGYLRTEVDNLREGVRRGFTTPRHNVDLVLGQLDALLGESTDKWPLASPARRDGDPAFQQAWADLLATKIVPAVTAYRDYLRGEYRAQAREEPAVTALPDGAACYRASLRTQTSLDRSPDEVMALGQRTVDANLSTALAIGREKLGVADLPGLVRAFDSPDNHFRDRDEELAFARSAVERAGVAVRSAFSLLPTTQVRVEPRPEEEGPSAPDSYGFPQGARHYGVYRINLARFAETKRSQAEIAAFHETLPGHHVQVCIALEQAHAHPITKLLYTGSYSEGWARYAEGLAEELGLYQSDAARAQRRLWAARGMVVDPGVNAHGWSREKAVAFMTESGRFAPKMVEALFDRIAVGPGELLSYDTGGLEILALREEAKRELGPLFDLRAFHKAVLEHGAVTLPMLRELVREWIRQEKARG